MADLVASLCRAPTFLELREWCARDWPSLAPTGRRYQPGSPSSSGIAWRFLPRTSVVACADDSHSSSPSDRFVDSRGGSAAGSRRVVTRVLSPREPLDVCPHGHPRCRGGASGARSVVSRCPPLWMEAYPHFRLIGLSAPLNSLQDISLPQKRYSRSHFRVISSTEVAIAKPEVVLSANGTVFRLRAINKESNKDAPYLD